MGLDVLFNFYLLKSGFIKYIKPLEKFLFFFVIPKFSMKYLYININPVYLKVIMNVLRLSLLYNFKVLYDILIIDNLYLNKFKIIYSLLNVNENLRLFVYAIIDRVGSSINSLNMIFKSSGWLEREAWDMFGLFFLNNCDLRKILTDYGFRGYPLKKDFPLSGFIELFFEDSASELIYRPIRLVQELRFFN